MMKAMMLFLSILVLTIVGAGPIAADEVEEALYRRIFEKNVSDYGAVFSDGFRKAVPEGKLMEVIDLYQKKLGDFRQVVGKKGSYEVLFTRGKAPSTIGLDKAGKIAGFWLGEMILLDDSLEKIAAEWKALPGSAAVTLLADGRDPVFEISGNAPLAVGSTFKLYILKTLDQACRSGAASLSAMLPLNPDWISLPTGILQDWPAKAPVTLDTLANLMISISDNTATDHLLFFLGRSEVEKNAPATMRPFLATMEMFRLKYGPEDRARKFIAADTAGRLALLASISTESVALDQIKADPLFIDAIEWFASTRELAALIHELREIPALRINPGLVDKVKWYRCAYKGGSERGVLNYTIALQKAPASASYALSATINNPAGDQANDEFTSLVMRLITLIEDGRLGSRQ